MIKPIRDISCFQGKIAGVFCGVNLVEIMI